MHFVTVAADAAAHHFETHQLAREPRFLLLQQRLLSEEIALIEFYHPRKIRLEWSDRRVNFMTVQCHFCFEAKRVARAQAAWFDAEFLACVHDFAPNPLGLFRCDKDFEAVFAGVSRSRDARWSPAYSAVAEMVIPEIGRA